MKEKTYDISTGGDLGMSVNKKDKDSKEYTDCINEIAELFTQEMREDYARHFII